MAAKAEPKRKKTGGREAACFGLAVWGAVTIQYFFRTDPEFVAGYQAAYTGMSTAVWLAATAAFGWQRVAGAVAARTDPEGAEEWRD